MGICISLGKNKNKNKKDELDKNIKMNLEDNNKQILLMNQVKSKLNKKLIKIKIL